MADECLENCSTMQLFYELKQKFPSAPDPVVSECIRQSNNDPAKCEALLRASCASKGFAAGRRRGDSASEDVSRLRTKLRPTFLPTRPLYSSPELRSPFQGGPLQEPHRFSRRASDQSQTTASPDASRCESRDPTPPPRPPLPPSMVQDPLMCASCFRPDDLFYQDYEHEVSVNCSAQGVLVTSSCSSPVGSPLFNPPVRHTASLQVHPTPHFLARPASLTSVCSSPTAEPRSYTSVNLTLRPPSSDPQPPIDIRSTSKLTYSTSSYSPRQGFQSQLHIQIGPGGGSVAAMRTASQPPMSSPSPPPPPLCRQVLVRTVSMPDVCSDSKTVEQFKPNLSLPLALRSQMERKARLEAELQTEKKKLEQLKRDVHAMEKDLELRRSSRRGMLHSSATATTLRIQELRVEVYRLQEECNRMAQEVDLHNTTVPLGETDEEFYQNISPERRTTIITTENQQYHSSWRMRGEARGAAPSSDGPEEEDEDGPHWTCSVCTFRNHPALRKCEQCEMPRISLGVVHSWVV
ncbi:TGF-beta-activated kinase 1 and MAP3K7-binding protein 2-like isoform X2 [Neocloeon triangulifer]|uniref:TGF-beta-activated kinase 1 and MAP3K7-binding protein 2-like isoform X2 n=1 Tax=Neocloeon triangulifer TaxID=2078957 RepID=UPI00286F2789|nr:TGF-beta-activated kinase 1 and MAP3K7-binding protein 2-like isoform X2 [Neocloeon triangulifer]XP_059476692.1 TGF-beta-activated kinase 1 and MAP3K7-binding protein 2-like isoform X2 [Neocloeon triangulifer]